jgi:SAM-dependent methyltransferase
MLGQAQSRARQAGLAIEWVCLPMQQLAASVRQRFDAILCMGNSLPHLLTDADLDAALRGFVKLLNPGGVVILQLLNYVRVLGGQERIVGIDRRGDREYVRFYDFLGDRVRFNILEIQWKDATAKHELHSTTLRPYTAGELTAALVRAGCESVETFGGLAFAPFASGASQTVMLVGHADEGQKTVDPLETASCESPRKEKSR